MRLLPLLLLSAAAGLAAAQAEAIEFCGSAPYYPSEYACYGGGGGGGGVLCPRLYGRPTLPCSGACYSPAMYRCCDGQLQLLPTAGGGGASFRLEVHSARPSLDGRPLHVCGLRFHAGADARTCVYCYDAPPQSVCAEFRNETVLMPSGEMAVGVPGGQAWFVDPQDGRLRTTAGGKGGGYGREYAGKNVTIYEEGYFSYDGSSHWLACKEPGGGERYGIFAGTIDRTDCEKIKLVAVPTTDPKQGAYSYT